MTQPDHHPTPTETEPANGASPKPPADLHLRPFRRGDGPALLAAWRQAAPLDPITPGRFRDLVLLDRNFDPDGLLLAVHADGRVAGAAYGVRRLTPLHGTDAEPEQGWLPFFFVTPADRGRGLGRRLVGGVLDWLRGLGRTRVDFASYTPNYLLPGLDAAGYPEAAGLLDAMGFRTLYEAAAMDRSLVGYQVPQEVRSHTEELVARGYRFATPTDDDLVDLVRLAGAEFNPDWARAIRECVPAGTPLERIVTVREPGEQRLVGWAMHGAYEGVLERFGPFGVRESERGRGLGKVLLHLTLERMRGLGAHSAWFLWTGERSPAGHLYRATGFTTTRTFRVMRWEAP